MRPIGFSTGSVAGADFQGALSILDGTQADAVELSALREPELIPLIEAVDSIDLGQYRHVSIHAPSRYAPESEAAIADTLFHFIQRQWPVVLHPDAIHSFEHWRPFGELLLIENMDKRKRIGRTVEELDAVFEALPDARMCFDLAHARQCDSSMTEAYRILIRFAGIIRQIHLSEVGTDSSHARISPSAAGDFREVAHLIPSDLPIILETPVSRAEVAFEIKRAQESLFRKVLEQKLA